MSDLFPPFAPDAHEPRKRLFKPVPFRVIAPNLITLIALCLGLTAIRLAYEGRLEPAVIAIVVAAVLDGVDGRVARLLKGTSRFGAELDSLADFLNFGVAPALVSTASCSITPARWAGSRPSSSPSRRRSGSPAST
jgi:CDP-diacylglycerol--serine O-phosphatidyltransferase